jgi:hypothetical protein
MMEGTIERTARVWHREYTISVYQTSKTAWVAKGEYMGCNIEVEGRSVSAAEKAGSKQLGTGDRYDTVAAMR